MTPAQHLQYAEAYAKQAQLPGADIKLAVLAVAHALLVTAVQAVPLASSGDTVVQDPGNDGTV